MRFRCLIYLLAGLALLWLSASANATVFNIPDGDVTALKSAINTSNTNGQDDTIELATNGIYTLTTVDNTFTYGDNGLPIIRADSDKMLTIHGNGATIQRSTAANTPEFRILHVDGATVTAAQLTVRGGFFGDYDFFAGGGIYNYRAFLVLTNCTITGNRASSGGGIYSSGSGATASLKAIDTIFENNIAAGQQNIGCSGGAIYNSGNNPGIANLTIAHCSFIGNSASGAGGTANDSAGAIANWNPGDSAIVMISDSIFQGNTTTGTAGAVVMAALNSSATMVITNSSFLMNSSTNNYNNSAGGILNFAANDKTSQLVVRSCTFTGNMTNGGGGAICNDAGLGAASRSILAVSDTAFVLNQAANGGAISSRQSFALTNGRSGFSVTNSTFIGNSAGYGGGAVFVIPATTTSQLLTNCTFKDNAVYNLGTPSYDGGGAICISAIHATTTPDATLTVRACTFANNTAPFHGGAICNLGSSGAATVFLGNSIFKTGSAGENIYNADGTISSQGFNVSDDNGGTFFVATGDQINTDPMLDPSGLQNNGGPTQTIALLPGSPAINAGDPNAPARDQRYYLRNGVPDKGAFEYGGPLAPISAASRKTHGPAGTFDVDLPLGGSAGIECRTGGAMENHQVVLNFATPITAASASVTSGIGSAASPSVNGSQMTVDLTGVANAQQITLTLSGVSDGVHTNDMSVPMRLLLGDTNGNGTVNASDIIHTKAQLGQAVTSSNFRNDVNANGTLNASDITVIKSQVGTSALGTREINPISEFKTAP